MGVTNETLTVEYIYYPDSDRLSLRVMDKELITHGELKLSGLMQDDRDISNNIKNVIGQAIADAVIRFRRRDNE